MQNFTNSSLVDYKRISPNRNPRKFNIDRVTIHCTAGGINKTAKQIADLEHFVKSGLSNSCSCNYAIGGDGSVSLIVEEQDRSWCSSSKDNDHRAVTIEVASDINGTNKVSDKAYKKLIELLADICVRNNIKELKWLGDKTQTDVKKQNMTVHRWFSNKACPGDYLYNLHGQIAKEVNERLKVLRGGKDMFKVGNLEIVNEKDHQRDSIKKAVELGVFKGNGKTFDVSENMTKGDFCVILDRLGVLK